MFSSLDCSNDSIQRIDNLIEDSSATRSYTTQYNVGDNDPIHHMSYEDRSSVSNEQNVDNLNNDVEGDDDFEDDTQNDLGQADASTQKDEDSIQEDEDPIKEEHDIHDNTLDTTHIATETVYISSSEDPIGEDFHIQEAEEEELEEYEVRSLGSNDENFWSDYEEMNADLCPTKKDEDVICRRYDIQCVVCQSPLCDKLSVIVPCCHTIHTECFDQLKMKTSKKCPICRDPVTDVRSLSKHSASPLLKMDNNVAREIIRDLLSEPQSPARYMGNIINVASPPHPDTVRRQLFTSPRPSTSTPSTSRHTTSLLHGRRLIGSGSLVQKRLIRVYEKANMEIFENLLPSHVRFIVSPGGKSKVLGTAPPRMIIKIKEDSNSGRMVTDLIRVMESEYVTTTGGNPLSGDRKMAMKRFCTQIQRECILGSDSLSDSDSDEEK
jgi:hypothetical protein